MLGQLNFALISEDLLCLIFCVATVIIGLKLTKSKWYPCLQLETIKKSVIHITFTYSSKQPALF